MPRRPWRTSLSHVSRRFGSLLRRPCHSRPREPTCFLPGSRLSMPPASSPIFLPSGLRQEDSAPRRRRTGGGAMSRRCGLLPPAFQPGLLEFRFVEGAGLRGGPSTQVATTERLCYFSLSWGWRPVEVGESSMGELNSRSEPNSPLQRRDFLFILPTPS